MDIDREVDYLDIDREVKFLDIDREVDYLNIERKVIYMDIDRKVRYLDIDREMKSSREENSSEEYIVVYNSSVIKNYHETDDKYVQRESKRLSRTRSTMKIFNCRQRNDILACLKSILFSIKHQYVSQKWEN